MEEETKLGMNQKEKAKSSPAKTAALTTVPGQTEAIPPFATAVDCGEGHELILQSIAANGVKRIFFCGGTDNFHFMESVAKFKALGKPTPDSITVMHESDAVYMNMGYLLHSEF